MNTPLVTVLLQECHLGVAIWRDLEIINKYIFLIFIIGSHYVS